MASQRVLRSGASGLHRTVESTSLQNIVAALAFRPPAHSPSRPGDSPERERDLDTPFLTQCCCLQCLLSVRMQSLESRQAQLRRFCNALYVACTVSYTRACMYTDARRTMRSGAVGSQGSSCWCYVTTVERSWLWPLLPLVEKTLVFLQDVYSKVSLLPC